MRSTQDKTRARKVSEPVPRGKAREEALAAIEAEARRRILATPSPLDSITPEQLAEQEAKQQKKAAPPPPPPPPTTPGEITREE